MSYIGCNNNSGCDDHIENINHIGVMNLQGAEEIIDRCELMNKPGATIFDLYNVESLEKKELEKISKAQLKQDIFAYLELNRKNNGFFVEFGATNGISLSNSYMLEKNFAWKGILAEPATMWHKDLQKNRPDSYIENSCVWKESHQKLMFNQVNVYSTVDQYSDKDMHSLKREKGLRYEVETISLSDLLEKYNAPDLIDYLSIDTEGSEFDILDAFFKNNNKYKIKIITCEHNYTHDRENIYNLLTAYGYKRINQCISKFDDFYVSYL